MVSHGSQLIAAGECICSHTGAALIAVDGHSLKDGCLPVLTAPLNGVFCQECEHHGVMFNLAGCCFICHHINPSSGQCLFQEKEVVRPVFLVKHLIILQHVIGGKESVVFCLFIIFMYFPDFVHIADRRDGRKFFL